MPEEAVENPVQPGCVALDPHLLTVVKGMSRSVLYSFAGGDVMPLVKEFTPYIGPG